MWWKICSKSGGVFQSSLEQEIISDLERASEVKSIVCVPCESIWEERRSLSLCHTPLCLTLLSIYMENIQPAVAKCTEFHQWFFFILYFIFKKEDISTLFIPLQLQNISVSMITSISSRVFLLRFRRQTSRLSCSPPSWRPSSVDQPVGQLSLCLLATKSL